MRALFTIFLIISVVVFSDVLDIKDVPEHSEDYSIIAFLVKNGIMDIENGKFNGSTYVSKYMLARYIYRLVQFIGKEFELGPSAQSPVNVKTLEAFQDKLDRVSANVIANENSIKTLSSSITALESSMNSLRDIYDEKFADLEGSITSVIEKFKEGSEILKKIQTDLGDFGENLRKLDEKLKEIEKEKLMDIENSVLSLQSSSAALEEKLRDLSKKIEGISGFFESFPSSMDYLQNLSKKLGELDLRLTTLESEVSDLIKFGGETSKAVLTSKPRILVIYNYEDKQFTSTETSIFESSILTLQSSLISIEKITKDLSEKLKILYLVFGVLTLSEILFLIWFK